MINSSSDKVFRALKQYVESQSKYKPLVLKSAIEEKYPIVVFDTRSDIVDTISQDRLRLDTVRTLNFEISILAINNKKVTGQEICDELADLVCDVMNVYYLMQGGIDAKLHNINTRGATKYVLHFTYKYRA